MIGAPDTLPVALSTLHGTFDATIPNCESSPFNLITPFSPGLNTISPFEA
jgi:hypothetical protein